jgi:hypothetical protein
MCTCGPQELRATKVLGHVTLLVVRVQSGRAATAASKSPGWIKASLAICLFLLLFVVGCRNLCSTVFAVPNVREGNWRARHDSNPGLVPTNEPRSLTVARFGSPPPYHTLVPKSRSALVATYLLTRGPQQMATTAGRCSQKERIVLGIFVSHSLDWFLIRSERHLRMVVREWVTH